MKQLYNRIKEGILLLPLKDRDLCLKLLEENNLKQIKEIVDSYCLEDNDDPLIKKESIYELSLNIYTYLDYLNLYEDMEILSTEY